MSLYTGSNFVYEDFIKDSYMKGCEDAWNGNVNLDVYRTFKSYREGVQFAAYLFSWSRK